MPADTRFTQRTRNARIVKKYDSLVRLAAMGFNIMPAMLYDETREEKEIFLRLGSPPWAIRSEKEGETSCPFSRGYNSPYNLLREAKKLQRQGYSILLCSQPKEENRPLANGSILLPPRGHPVFEPCVEYGETETQRDLQHVALKSLTWWTKNTTPLEERLITEVLGEALSRCSSIPCILEWSLFSLPLGEQNSPTIWWEMRRWT